MPCKFTKDFAFEMYEQQASLALLVIWFSSSRSSFVSSRNRFSVAEQTVGGAATDAASASSASSPATMSSLQTGQSQGQAPTHVQCLSTKTHLAPSTRKGVLAGQRMASSTKTRMVTREQTAVTRLLPRWIRRVRVEVSCSPENDHSYSCFRSRATIGTAATLANRRISGISPSRRTRPANAE